MRLNDRVNWAALFAESAENTFGQINVITRRPTCPIGSDIGFDQDRLCWADRFTEFAGNTALLTIRIPPQRMQAAESWRIRRLLLWVLNGDLLGKQVPTRERHATEHL
jgi:hypothetical protein